MAEWSKATDLGSVLFGGVGSNPTPVMDVDFCFCQLSRIPFPSQPPRYPSLSSLFPCSCSVLSLLTGEWYLSLSPPSAVSKCLPLSLLIWWSTWVTAAAAAATTAGGAGSAAPQPQEEEQQQQQVGEAFCNDTETAA